MHTATITPGNPWSARLVALATSSALATLYNLSLPGTAHAMGDDPDLEPVGRVITARGEVIARQPDDDSRSLGRGDHVYEGDTLLTGDSGRAQVRFIDEGLVQLQPETEYFIEHYREDEAERGAFTRLVEGGLRALSGSIGEQDRENYRLDTPVASIGIRGTHYAVNHCAADCEPDLMGSVGGVIDGRIGVSNAAGEEEFGRNEFFAVRDANTPPERLAQPPAGLLDATDADEADDEDEDAEAVDETGEVSGPDDDDEDDLFADDGLTPGTEQAPRATDGVAAPEYITDGRPLAFLSLGQGTQSSTIEAELDFSSGLPALSYASTGEESYATGEESEVALTLRIAGHVDPAQDLQDAGGAVELGVSWGRWAAEDVEISGDGETWDSAEGDWYWVAVDDVSRITEDVSALAHLGEQTFSWEDGTSSVGVNEFTLVADFSSLQLFTSGSAEFASGDSFSYEGGAELSSLFNLDMQGEEDTLHVHGALVGDAAEGAVINFINDYGGSIEGAGLLLR